MNNDEPKFGGALMALITSTTPLITIINTLGGIVGLIWLLILGEWRLALGWFFAAILFVIVYSFLLVIIQMPFMWVTQLFISKKHRYSAVIAAGTNLLIGYLINLTWAFLVFGFIVEATRGLNSLPYLIYGYGLAVGPFQYIASKESPDNLPTFLAVWLNAIAYVLLVVFFYLGVPIIATISIFIILVMVMNFSVRYFNLALKELPEE